MALVREYCLPRRFNEELKSVTWPNYSSETRRVKNGLFSCFFEGNYMAQPLTSDVHVKSVPEP